jgi:hypothetical protein
VVEPPTPLKNDGVSSSVGVTTFPTEWKNKKKCSKPPTRKCVQKSRIFREMLRKIWKKLRDHLGKI